MTPEVSWPAPEPWRAHAACVTDSADPRIFEDETDQFALMQARAVCAECPVAAECLALGQSLNADGVWGGQPLRAGRVAGARA